MISLNQKNNFNHIVFLPGLGIKACVFNKIMKISFFNLKPILLELPYLPDSIAMKNEDIQMEYITKMLASKIPENSILCGWSLGGLIAINICKSFPSKIKTLITIASTPKFRSTSNWVGIPDNYLNAFKALAKSDLKAIIQKFKILISYPFHPSQIEAIPFYPTNQDRYDFLSYLTILSEIDSRVTLKNLNMPVLHIFGEKDAIVPIETERQIKGMINVETKILKNAGHYVCVTHAEELAAMIKSFVLKNNAII